jgi:single-strand DNA-binding protein
MNYNKVILAGHLVRDPEMRNTNSGTAVANASIAVNHKWTTAAGEKQESVSFVDCKVWGKTAENFSKFFSKGRPVLVEGRLEQESWEDKTDGSKRSKLVVVVERFEFVPQGKNADADDKPSTAAPAPARKVAKLPAAVPADEIPFAPEVWP